MLEALFRLSGLESLFQAIEAKLSAASSRLQSLAVNYAIAVGVAAMAAIVVLLALGAALILLFLVLEPEIGRVGAIGAIAAGLVVLSMVLIIVARSITRRPVRGDVGHQRAVENEARTIADKLRQDEKQSVAEAAHITAPPPVPVTSRSLDDMIKLSSKLISVPKTGNTNVDDFITSLRPQAEAAGRDVLARAARLVRDGDRSVLFSVLVTAVAAGWALSSVNRHKPAE